MQQASGLTKRVIPNAIVIKGIDISGLDLIEVKEFGRTYINIQQRDNGLTVFSYSGLLIKRKDIKKFIRLFVYFFSGIDHTGFFRYHDKNYISKMIDIRKSVLECIGIDGNFNIVVDERFI